MTNPEASLLMAILGLSGLVIFAPPSSPGSWVACSISAVMVLAGGLALHRLASAGLNPEGGDAQQGSVEDEHAVAEGETPNA